MFGREDYYGLLTRQLLSSSADRMMVPHFFPGIPLWRKERREEKLTELKSKQKHKKTHFVFDQSVISNQSVRIKAYSSLSELVQKKSSWCSLSPTVWYSQISFHFHAVKFLLLVIQPSDLGPRSRWTVFKSLILWNIWRSNWSKILLTWPLIFSDGAFSVKPERSRKQRWCVLHLRGLPHSVIWGQRWLERSNFLVKLL